VKQDAAVATDRPSVLIVDDDENSRIIYRIALEHARFRVHVATDGREGVEAARETDPDVILMDIAMPGTDGREALRQLRSSPETRGIPVIALTAQTGLHNRGELVADGFDAVLLKPTEPVVVVSAVRLAVAADRRAAEAQAED
jgi:CheY-like chemotaxis protein